VIGPPDAVPARDRIVTAFVLLPVLLSASPHVLWNALIKQADNKGSFLWLTIVASTAMPAPA